MNLFSSPEFLKDSATHKQKLSLHPTPPQLTLLGFIFLIGIGSFMLWLPCSVTQPEKSNYLIALFTATSAVCVTGLSTVDPGKFYSLTGQLILITLIQLGGLGYMTLYSLMILAVGKRMSLRDRLAIQQVLDLPGPGGVVRFVQRILILTLIIEGLGGLLLASVWVPQMGWKKGFYFSIFHSISAFNNAGFSLFSDNLMHFQDNHVVLITISFLVITGGLGYPVLSELWIHIKKQVKNRDKFIHWRYLTLHTRICILSTGFLLILGTIVFWLLEVGNSNTFAPMNVINQWCNAFFHSVMPRTAGFNSVNIASMTQASLFFSLSLMLIGANPGGTGGGIKTTTLIIVLNQSISALKGKEELIIFQRKISVSTKNKALATIVFSILWINLVTLILACIEKLDLFKILFEVVSAFATVGLSSGITPLLSPIGQLLIILTMYIGRVGVITLGTALFSGHRRSLLKYPEENLLVS